MKKFNTERIELTLIFAGVFLATYLFLMGCADVWEVLWHVFIV